MMVRLLLASILFLSFKEAGVQYQPVQWEATHRLSWNDFKAAPPATSTNAALTRSGILMSFSTNGENFTFELTCTFDPNNSWGRVKNDYILAHEQAHFDIAELYTRKLNKALQAYRYQPATFNKDVNTIYQNLMRELQQTQEMYDQQSDHSRNVAEQNKWLVKIKNSLDDLKNFSDYRQ